MASVTVTRKAYGSVAAPDGSDQVTVHAYTLDNGRMSAEVLTYGATLASVLVPDKNGTKADVALGFDDIEGFAGDKNQYLGATVGRVANRIGGGSFAIDGVRYNVSKNVGPHTLHGGLKGFDKKVWDARVEGDSVVMNCSSPDGEEGFPGAVEARATYRLTEDDRLEVVYTATSDKKTPVNIVNHVYLNLGGHGAGAEGLFEHRIKVNGDSYTELTPDYSIPTGAVLPVEGTPYDLRAPADLGAAIEAKGSGYDINYAVRGEGLREVATLTHPSGRRLDVWSDQPGVQLYTSNFLIDVPGKDGVVYQKYGAVCLETQAFPDAVNHPNFPSSILEPGRVYKHTLSFRFGVDN